MARDLSHQRGDDDHGPLRSDARQNRDRIVEAARRLFAARGVDVPVATVARHAGVGVATLYRRFPTREALVEQAFAEEFAACTAAVRRAAADPDPWQGFATAVGKVCEMQSVDRGFGAAFLAALPQSPHLAQERDQVFAVLGDLVRRAQAAGSLRPDFTLDDLALVVMANSGIVAAAPEGARRASRRLVGYLLSGFRADGLEPIPPAAGPGLLEELGLAGPGVGAGTLRRSAPRAPRRPSSP
ncbi:TetR/AcrR family transcriptional regulator [Isoptericola hypogeus]|uniref:TetR/AcrR family transcriptional regulator n=1 Tax=Isoptericola hypogeus TaxID=300179 RepID=A0ABP4VST2_9MICO